MSETLEGELKVYNNNGSFRWYINKGSESIYLPKRKRTLAERYAFNKFLSLKRELLLEKKYYTESCLEGYSKAYSKVKNYIENPGYFDLISNSLSFEESVEKWRKQDYNTNPNYANQLKYQCPDGQYVRSKSEVFISMALNKHGIPYRYECELVIGENKFYPDFTILNPNTKELLYWEHLGRMDDEAYASGVYRKLKILYQNGLIPGKNLFLSFETQDNPFSYADAEATISLMKL